MLLSTDRIYLRPPRATDAEAILAWENDPELQAYSDQDRSVTPEDVRAFLDEEISDIHIKGQLRLIICLREDDSVIGAIDLYDFNARHLRCGVGINVDKEYRGTGLGTEALGLLISYASGTLGIHQLWCTIPVSNLPSLRIFEKQGFVQAGILSDWLLRQGGTAEDVVFCQRRL